MTSSVQGSCDPKYARVREEFERNFAERGELGASACVIVDGEVVVDLWGGVADPATGRPWERDTLNGVMSCSKGLAAICGNMLMDRGELDPDLPVAHYWPEFAQKGKARIPVRMVFNHQSGVCHVDAPVPPDGLLDWDLFTGMLARTTPFWEPGTATGYHGLSMGYLVGELVRRVSGRSIGRFFRDEVAEPLGLDAWFGLPEEHEPRVAASILFDLGLPEPPDWLPVSLSNPAAPAIKRLARVAMATPPLRRAIAARMRALTEAAGVPPHMVEQLSDVSSLQSQIFGNTGGLVPHSMDTRAAHAAELPSAGAVANARALAGAYAPLSIGGTLDGVRIVSPAALPRMRAAQSTPEVDLVAGARTSYTMGFSKSWPNPGLEGSSLIIGEHAFGTPGLGGQIGFADDSRRLAMGYTMTKHGPGTGLNERGQALVDAVYETLGSPTCEPGFWVGP